MTASRTLLLSIALLLVACKPSAPKPADAAPAVSATPAADSAANPCPTPAQPDAKACVAKDFTVFLQRFADDEAVQRASTVDPLGESSVDADGKTSTKYLPMAEIKFPLIYGAKEQAARGLVQKVAESAADQRVVTVAKPDTDIQTTYTFMADPCWKLVGLSDDTPTQPTDAPAH